MLPAFLQSRKAILRWPGMDGIPRLGKMLHRCLGAEDTPLNEAIGTKLMSAIVRRSKRPGCKYDHEVVLQGDQGARKSMFCEDLAVFPDLFTDAGDLAGSMKEQMEIAQGKQIIEFPELAGFSQNSRERNKAYLSRRVDRARLAYGHYAKDEPRSSSPWNYQSRRLLERSNRRAAVLARRGESLQPGSVPRE